MQNGRNDVQLVAGADLSSSRYLLVKLDGTIPADATEVAVGAITTPGGNGDRISVAYQGISTCVAGDQLTPFGLLMADGNGKVIDAVTGLLGTNTIVGQYIPELENGSINTNVADEEVRVFLFADKTRLVP